MTLIRAVMHVMGRLIRMPNAHGAAPTPSKLSQRRMWFERSVTMMEPEGLVDRMCNARVQTWADTSITSFFYEELGMYVKVHHWQYLSDRPER